MIRHTDFETGIIGSGLGGIAVALKLRKAGKQSFVIFERADEPGGVWRDNRYPGCRCDVAAHAYSFADEPNPHWDHVYATQQEMLSYINHVVDKHDLRKAIRFNANIIKAVFDADQAHWLLTDQQGNTVSVKTLIVALGKFNRAVTPHFKDIDLYTGKIIHSSKWDNDFQLRDKKIAVIGTGASAVQIIPSIAAELEQLTVFQRSPAWIAGFDNPGLSAARKRRFERYPFLMRQKRIVLFWQTEILGLLFFGPSWINSIVQQIFLKKLKKEVRHPDTQKKLRPDYQLGCKRAMRSDDYYPTFNRSNVNLETDGIQCFTPSGIVTTSGKTYELDGVIMATGFEVAEMNFEIDIIGPDSKNLREVWQSTNSACYLGMFTNGFPNLAVIGGPNASSGFGSSLTLMEYQADYTLSYINAISTAGNNSYLDIKQDIQNTYMADLQKRFVGTVWASGCKSWQQNRNGKNVTTYPGLSSAFRKKTRKFKIEEYTLQHN